jgi:three-Cys-motif partner protein
LKEKDVKLNILPHTQAKLDLYNGYLEHYLRVLCYASFCEHIKIFDIYCGAGIYQDGKKGSPLLALECIKKVGKEIIDNGKTLTPISLFVNDYDPKKVENVKEKADTQGIENLKIEYSKLNANEMLDVVSNHVKETPKNQRNLVFIDPYGYSDIKREKIIALLENKRTEIILFLPVMQMYRFTNIALEDEDRPHYENLRNFISMFFNDQSYLSTDSIFKYIQSIKEALSINNTYYTCSHYIERSKGSYYALFFIGSNIYGLEKMLETKWSLDPVKGEGFDQEKDMMQFTMFDDEINENDHLREISYLEDIIFSSLKQRNSMTNVELYELTLRNEFLPKHAKEAIDNLIKKKKIKKIGESKGYNINYQNYKDNIILSKFEVI